MPRQRHLRLIEVGWPPRYGDTVAWFDAKGVFHERGRPACLPASTDPQPVTFTMMPVQHGGVTWREVVSVTCRH